MADITPDTLDQLARICSLQADLKLPKLQVLLSLWADIDTHGDDSLYKKLFLNKATLQIEQNSNPSHQIDLIFEPDKDGSVLIDPTLKISDHLPTLAGALAVSAADLDAIRSDAGLADDPTANPPVYAPLNLTSVSKLYRYTALAKALKLRILDLIALKTLSGIDPFSTTEQTVQFVTVQK